MPSQSLRDQIEPTRRAAIAFIAMNNPNSRQRADHDRALENAEDRLRADIDERNGAYLEELDREENEMIGARREETERQPNYQRALAAQRAAQERFQSLRLINHGQYPVNLSPALYVIPLILVGVAEWYVNYSTFSAMFIPVFAIAATIIVAAVFAWASDLHGAYIKQISEIMHPSEEYRNILGRRIAIVISTVLLIAGFATVVWLRWLIISEQLGTDTSVESGVFGGESGSLVWSKVGPTIVINLLIWGLGT
jgi:predicted  nucleic acid-binding Zn-ribbon protein